MFNWLPLSERKNICIPKVIIEPNTGQSYSGYCTNNGKLVCVVDIGCEKSIASTLAHEFRHVCQVQLNTYDLTSSKAPRKDMPYEEMIAWYFKTQEHEMDALLFEVKHAKTDLNNWWLNRLVKGY